MTNYFMFFFLPIFNISKLQSHYFQDDIGSISTIVSLLFDPLQLQNIFDRCRDELMKTGAVHDVRSTMKNLETDRNRKSHLWWVFNFLE